MRIALFAILALLTLSGPAEAGRKPAADILGIRLGMPEAEVRKKLLKIGKPESDLASLKQSWKLDHKHYGYMAVRYGNDWKVKWVSVFAKPEGKKLKFKEIGPLDKARLTGRYIYTWDIPGGDDIPGVQVTARGSDPEVLSGLSISALPIARPLDTPELPDTMYLGPQ
jgi:hypothetical protein